MSPEELRERMERPEPKFVLLGLSQRVNMLIMGLDNYSAAPSKTQLEQMELVKKAIEDASQKVAKLIAEDVAAMNAAKAPTIHVP